MVIGHWSLVWAQDGEDGEVEGTATPAAEVKKIDYVLPYPGVLPDSPLWPIKDLRDKVIGLFVFDPVAKGQYNLHLADKRLAAGMALIDGGKRELGLRTLVSAEQYLSKALEKDVEARLRKIDTATLDAQLSKAVRKHMEIISEKAGEEALRDATNIYNRIRKLFEGKLPSF